MRHEIRGPRKLGCRRRPIAVAVNAMADLALGSIDPLARLKGLRRRWDRVGRPSISWLGVLASSHANATIKMAMPVPSTHANTLLRVPGSRLT